MRRLVVLLAGAGLLLSAAAPALAGGTARAATPRSLESEALAVLERAVAAGRTVGYRGTQHVAVDAREDVLVVDVSHRPGHRSVVRASADGGTSAVPTPALDARVVAVLADSYDLAVAGSGRCAGRATTVVEARRDDGRLAGRFEVDRASGLLLRREVSGDDGSRLRTSVLVDLEVGAVADVPPVPSADLPAATSALRSQGWRVPDALPGGFRLVDARLSAPGDPEHVLHLAYSDGLSATSLFAQRGRLGTSAPDGFERELIAGRPVWVRSDVPERVVWSGGGAVWTLVSDASAAAVRDVVGSLPRDRERDDGLLARLGRGLGRLVSALDPFD